MTTPRYGLTSGTKGPNYLESQAFIHAGGECYRCITLTRLPLFCHQIVTGAVVTSRCPQTGDSLFLLCRRAIPPRRGFFNLCAGYMEKGESLAEAAAREAREEAGAQIEIGQILGIFDISHIGQVHIYFKATLSNTDIKPGYESLDARLLRWDEIPWGDLAFPTVSWALMAWEKQAALGGKWGGTPFRNPVLSEYEGSTNVWYRPDKGGLVHDESWMRREGREESVGSAGERQGRGGAGECKKSAQETHERDR